MVAAVRGVRTAAVLLAAMNPAGRAVLGAPATGGRWAALGAMRPLSAVAGDGMRHTELSALAVNVVTGVTGRHVATAASGVIVRAAIAPTGPAATAGRGHGPMVTAAHGGSVHASCRPSGACPSRP